MPPALQACPLPIHVLIESPATVRRAFEIAAHPRVQPLSFGLIDFVSAHAGAIPAVAMASACHAHGKVPSHRVVTEFRDPLALERAHQTGVALGPDVDAYFSPTVH